MKIDWDRYVDEDEEEEGFDKSAVSFFCIIWLYDYVYVKHFPLLIYIFQTTSLKYSLMEVWIWEAWIWEVWGECLEVRQQTNKYKGVACLSGVPFFSK